VDLAKQLVLVFELKVTSQPLIELLPQRTSLRVVINTLWMKEPLTPLG
jgi:hypothetical protein